MKNSIKTLLVIFLCIIALAGAGIGAYFLITKNIKKPEPQNKYTPVVQDFINQLQNSNGKLNTTTEDIVLPLDLDVNVSNILNVTDDYLLVNSGSGKQFVTRGNPVSVVDLHGCVFDTVIEIYGDYALLKNGEDAPFVVNLKTGHKIREGLVYEGYSDVFDSDIYHPGYAFVGNYLVISMEPVNYSFDEKFNVCVYDLKTGDIAKHFVYDEDLDTSGDFVISYATTEKYLAIRTLTQSSVFDLTGDTITTVATFENLITKVTNPSVDPTFDYMFDASSMYVTKYEHYLTVFDNGTIFISRKEQVDLLADADYTARDYRHDGKLKNYTQTCSYYDINRGTTKQLDFSGYYVETKLSSINGFVNLIKTKIAENKQKSNEKISEYYQVSTFDVAFCYDYSKYGDLISFYDDRLVCSKVSSSAKILNLTGEEIGHFTDGYANISKVVYGQYFVLNIGSQQYLADVYGNIINSGGTGWKEISPVVNGYAIAKEQHGDRQFVISATDSSYRVQIDQIYQDGVPFDYAFGGNKFGTSFYIKATTGGNYNLYNLSGDLIAENLSTANLRFIRSSTGIKVVYKNSSEIKALICENESIANDKTVAFVNYMSAKRYSPQIAKADSGHEKITEIDKLSIQPKKIHGVDVYSGFLQESIKTSVNELIYENFKTDILNLKDGNPQRKLIYSSNQNKDNPEGGPLTFFEIDGTAGVTYEYEVFATFNGFKNDEYIWGQPTWDQDYYENTPADTLWENGVNYKLQCEMNVYCPDGYYFSFLASPYIPEDYLYSELNGEHYDYSAHSACYFDLKSNSTTDIRNGIHFDTRINPDGTQIDPNDLMLLPKKGIWYSGFYSFIQSPEPRDTITGKCIMTLKTESDDLFNIDVFLDKNKVEPSEYFEIGIKAEVAPVQYGTLNFSDDASTELSVEYIKSKLFPIGTAITTEYTNNVFRLQQNENGKGYNVIANDGFLINNKSGGNVEWVTKITGWNGSTVIEFIEAFSDLTFKDVSVEEKDDKVFYNETDLIAEAIINGNTGRNGTTQILNSETDEPFPVVYDATKPNELYLTKLFNCQNEEGQWNLATPTYRVYSGGNDTLSRNFAGESDFGGGFYGLVNNVKATGFPFKIVRAGYNLDALNLTPGEDVVKTLFKTHEYGTESYFAPNSIVDADGTADRTKYVEDLIKKNINSLTNIYYGLPNGDLVAKTFINRLNVATISSDENIKSLQVQMANMRLEPLDLDYKFVDKFSFSTDNSKIYDYHAYLFSPIYQLFQASENAVGTSGTKTENGLGGYQINSAYGVEGDSGFNRPYKYNSGNSANLYAQWSPKPYNVIFYSESEKVQDVELVGNAYDWYYPELDEAGEYVLMDENIENSNRFVYTNQSEYVVLENAGYNYGYGDTLGIGVKTRDNKKVTYGTKMVGLPIPVKYGYDFVGWVPIKTLNSTMGYTPSGETMSGKSMLKEGDVLSFDNCDVDSLSNTLLFRALWKAKDIEVQINFGDQFTTFFDDLTELDDIDDRLDSVSYNLNGWGINTSPTNGVKFTKTLSFDAFAEDEEKIFDMPTPIGTRWKIINYLYTINHIYTVNNDYNIEDLDNTNDDPIVNLVDGIWDIGFIPFDDDGNQLNDKPRLAEKFNLVTMLGSINSAVKSKDEGEYIQDAITKQYYEDGENEFWLLDNGFNITTLKLEAIPINVDGFVKIESKVSDKEQNIAFLGEYSGIESGEDLKIDPATPAATQDIASFPGMGKISFSGLKCDDSNYQFDKLTLRVYTGGETEDVDDGNVAKSIDIIYNFTWKNNVYVGVNYGGVIAHNINGLSENELLELARTLLGLDSVNALKNNLVVLNTDGTISINSGNIVTAGTDCEASGYLRSLKDVNGDVLSVERRAFDLLFGMKEVEYNIVMGAFEDNGAGIDLGTIQNVAKFGLAGNESGEVGTIFVGEIDDGGGVNSVSTRNPKEIYGETRSGYAITSINKKGSKTLNLRNGGEIKLDGGDIYSHFLANFVVAKLSNDVANINDYDVASGGYTLINLGFSLTYNMVNPEAITINIDTNVVEFSEILGLEVVEFSEILGLENEEDGISFSVATVEGSKLTLKITDFYEETNTFDLSITYNINATDNPLTSDILVAGWFKEYKKGDYSLTQKFDNVTDNNVSKTKESVEDFNATTKILSNNPSIKLDNRAGYYLKQLTMTYLGKEQIILQGVPILSGETGADKELKYAYKLTNISGRDNALMLGSMIGISGWNSGAISEVGGAPNQYYYYGTLDNPFVPGISLYGLYDCVDIVAEFESVTRVTVTGSIIDFDGTNAGELDYQITFNTVAGPQITLSGLTFESYLLAPKGDGAENFAINNNYAYYDAVPTENSKNNRVDFLIVGKGITTADFAIKNSYKDYVLIDSVNANGSVEIVDSSAEGINPNGEMSNKTDDNSMVIALKKNTYNLTTKIELGYTDNNGNWQPYSASSYYSINDNAEYLKLINSRIGTFNIDYFGHDENPTNATYTNQFEKSGETTLTKIIELTVFKNKGVQFEVTLANNNYDSIKAVIDGNEYDFSVSNTFTIGASAASKDIITVEIRIEAKKFNVIYLANRPSELAGSEIYVTFETGSGAAKLYSDEETIDSAVKFVGERIPFDGFATSIEQFLDKEQYGLRLPGYVFKGWFSGRNDGAKFMMNATPLDDNFVDDGHNVDTNIPVYAHWEVKKVNIKFDLNDSVGSTKAKFDASADPTITVEYVFNQQYGTDMPTATRNGYTLSGWSDTPGLYINQGTPLTADDYMRFDPDGGTQTLYAVWEPKEYKVYFRKAGCDENGNGFIGGSVEDFTQSVEELSNMGFIEDGDSYYKLVKFDSNIVNGIGVTHNHPLIACVGYDFKGWHIDVMANGVSANPICDNGVHKENNWPMITETSNNLNANSFKGSDGFNVVGINVYPRWELQGVHVRLVTEASTDFETEADIARLNTLAWNHLPNNKKEMFGDYTGLSLTWLSKDTNGGNNGLTIDSNRYRRKTDSSADYDIIISYYQTAGTLDIDAPTAEGYTFGGYYYYDTISRTFTTQYINVSGEKLALATTWDKTWDKVNPVKLYALWTINTYTVSLSVNNANDILTTPLITGGATLGLALKRFNFGRVTSDNFGFINGATVSAINIDNSVSSADSVSTLTVGTDFISLTYLFFERMAFELTVPTGRYVSNIKIDTEQYPASWNKTGHYSSFGVTRRDNGIYNLEDLTLKDGSYYGIDSSAPLTNKYKRDLTGVDFYISRDYNIEFTFDIQKYDVTIQPVLFNGSQVVHGASLTPLVREDIVFGSEIDVTADLTVIVFYQQSGELYYDQGLTRDFEGDKGYVYDNITLYLKYIGTGATEHGISFYGLNNGGSYQEIETGNDYVYAFTHESWGRVENGKKYTWTKCLGEGGVILQTPVPTSFHWPTSVDGFNTGIKFVYWARLLSEGSIPTGPLTPYILESTYPGNYEKLEVGRHKVQAGAIYYAVYDSVDKGIQLVEDTSHFASANGTDKYFISREDDAGYEEKYRYFSFKVVNKDNDGIGANIDVKDATILGGAAGFAEILYENEARNGKTTNNMYIRVDALHASASPGSKNIGLKVVSSTGQEFIMDLANYKSFKVVDNQSYFRSCEIVGTGDVISHESFESGISTYYGATDGYSYSGYQIFVCIEHLGEEQIIYIDSGNTECRVGATTHEFTVSSDDGTPSSFECYHWIRVTIPIYQMDEHGQIELDDNDQPIQIGEELGWQQTEVYHPYIFHSIDVTHRSWLTAAR